MTILRSLSCSPRPNPGPSRSDSCMEPPRSPPLAAGANQEDIEGKQGDDPTSNNDDDTISLWDFLQEYCHINVNDIIARNAAPAVVPGEKNIINVDDNAPQAQHEEKDVDLALCQPSQHDCVKTQEESRCKGSGINLNLPPAEKKALAIPNNASPSLKTMKPYELPLLDLIGKKDAPPFAPVILESSEVAKAAADHQLHEFFHGAARCKNRVEPVGVAVPLPSVTVNMAPANKRRRYIWPANKVAKLDAKIEQLRKEAHLNPAHRRPFLLIQKDIDELQRKKDEIHATMLDMMMRGEDGDEGGSTSTQP